MYAQATHPTPSQPQAAFAIRQVPLPVHRALKERAVLNKRSTEAEVRHILATAVATPLKMGDFLVSVAQEFGGVSLDIKRDSSSLTPAVFT